MDSNKMTEASQAGVNALQNPMRGPSGADANGDALSQVSPYTDDCWYRWSGGSCHR